MNAHKSLFSKKSVLFLTMALVLHFPLFCQDENAGKESFARKIKFFVTAGPKMMINTDSTKKSAPHPIMFSGGIGCDIFEDRLITLQPNFTFFTNYYIWDGEDAQPAEVENRTATAFSFLIDLCAGHTWHFGKNSIQALGGTAFLLRYSIRSSGVHSGDLNPITLTKAGDDVKDINRWFYKRLNFLYPEICLSYMRHINQFWNIGADIRAYFPLGSLTHGEKFDGAIFSVAFKIQLPQISDIKSLFSE